MPMLDVDRLSVRYGTKQIVDALSFSVSEGQWLMIAGPNGAGKSTALAAITQGTPYTGRVLFEGQNVRSMKPALRARAFGTDALLMDSGRKIALGRANDVLTPANLDRIYGMDVAAWMRGLYSQWAE